MSRTQNGHLKGINEHPEILRDFVFALGNEQVPGARGHWALHTHFQVQIQNLAESRARVAG